MIDVSKKAYSYYSSIKVYTPLMPRQELGRENISYETAPILRNIFSTPKH